MHPDIKLDIARLRIQELHDQAARDRLVKGQRSGRQVPRVPGFWMGLGLGRLRSKAA